MRSGTGRSVLAIVVAVLVGAAAAVAGSVGGLRVGGWPVFALCTAVAYLVNWVAFVPAWLRRTERFYDLTGTLTYLTVVVIALVAGSRSSVAMVLGVLVAVWALRLGGFLVRRIRREGTDRRFDRIKQDPARFLVTWTLQALWVVLTAGAALAAMTSATVAGFGLIGVVGVDGLAGRVRHRDRRRRPEARLPGGPGEPRTFHHDWPVGLVPAPQLLRGDHAVGRRRAGRSCRRCPGGSTSPWFLRCS